MEQEPAFTEYDALVHSKDVQMLKSMLPFVDTQQQMPLAIMIQFIEFKNTIYIFQKNKNVLSAHSLNNKEDRKTAMLKAILQYVSPRERETFEQIMNMMDIMNMMRNSDNMSDIMNMMGDADNMSNIMNMMGNSDDFSNIMNMMGNSYDMNDFMNTSKDMAEDESINESQHNTDNT